MRFLIVDTYYPRFLRYFRKRYPQLQNASYKEYLAMLLNQAFGTSDYYSYNLRSLGHQAEDLILNDYLLQQKWAKEHNLSIPSSKLIDSLRSLPLVYRFLGRPGWIQAIALAQIEKYHPDILYIHDLTILNPESLREAKKHCKFLIGQIASPQPPHKYIKEFDLILTSFPHFVVRLRKIGINSEYLKIGFEPRILSKIGNCKRTYDVAFIGSYSYYHQHGTKILERVASELSVDFWGQGLGLFSLLSPIRKKFHGEAWGLDMYRILAQSKIVINRHIDAAENYANNMRLYEATGMGAMLITDEKKNLGELFEVGKEIVTYKDSEDLINKIRYFLNHEEERQKIDRAGQKRTFREHTYFKRMKELIKILEKYL